MDWPDAEGWADCFTPDGVFDGGPKLQARGRAGLVAFMERLIARDRPARHWTNNAVIEGDPSGPAAQIEDKIAAIMDSQPLRADILERYLLLLNDLPSVILQSILLPSWSRDPSRLELWWGS